MLVVETFDLALAYLEACANARKRCGGIVSLDGRFVSGNSWSDPDEKLGQLEFVYGYDAGVAKQTALYRALVHARRSVDEWKQSLAQVDMDKKELDHVKREHENKPHLQREQQGIKTRIQELQEARANSMRGAKRSQKNAGPEIFNKRARHSPQIEAASEVKTEDTRGRSEKGNEFVTASKKIKLESASEQATSDSRPDEAASSEDCFT